MLRVNANQSATSTLPLEPPDLSTTSLQMLFQMGQHWEASMNLAATPNGIDIHAEIAKRYLSLATDSLTAGLGDKHTVYKDLAIEHIAQALGYCTRLGVNRSDIAQILLGNMPTNQEFVEIDGAYIPRTDLSLWAGGQFPLKPTETHTLSTQLHGVTQLFHQTRGLGAANVHLPALLSNGARVLSALRTRIPPLLLPCTKDIYKSIVRAADMDTALVQALDFALAHQGTIREGELKTDVHEVVRLMWTYCDRQEKPERRLNLRRAFFEQLKDIGKNQTCHTGCVQRLLQTIEGIDDSFELLNTDQLMNDAQALTSRLDSVLDDKYQTSAKLAPERFAPNSLENILTFKREKIHASLYQHFVMQRRQQPDLVGQVIHKILDHVEENELQLANKSLGELSSNYMDHLGRTVIIRAVINNDISLLTKAIETDASGINKTDKQGKNALEHAFYSGRAHIVEKLLQVPQTNGQLRIKGGLTLLHLASGNGNLALVDVLLRFQNKLDICAKSNAKQTALHIATYCKHPAVIKKLLETGKFDICEKDIDGFSALDIACELLGDTELENALKSSAQPEMG